MRSKFKWIYTLLVALTVQFSFAQEKTITGTVSDANGSIPGVNVVVKGSTRGVSTGFDGKYSIKAKEGETLVFSFMGLNDITRVVAASNVINVAMQESAKELETVVVTSFNIKKRRDAIVSSNQVVNVKELTQASAPNVIQSLAGKVSGLQINSTSAGVNGSSRVVLRGPRSLTGDNQALVILDGAISALSVLDQLPPESVENVTVLKGQQGGTLYGEQGVNGVIIITTKRGNKGKLSVSLNSSVDIQSVSFVPEVQTKYGQGWYGYDFDFPNPSDPRNNSEHFSPYENGSWGESFENGPFANTLVPIGLPQANGDYLTGLYAPRGKDNIKNFYKDGILLQNGFTINSGNEDAYALVNYNRQTTDFVVEKDQLKRNTFLFKAGKKFGDLNVDGSFNYINTITTQTDNDLLAQLIQTPNNVDVTRYRNSGHTGNWTSFARNPYTLTNQIRFDDETNLFIGDIKLGYKFNKNISVNYSGNLRANHRVSETHDDGYKLDNYTYNINSVFIDNDNGTTPTYGQYSGGGDAGSSYFITQAMDRNLYTDLLLNFDYNLTDNLNLKFNVGGVVQDSKLRITQQGGENLDVPGFYNVVNVLAPTLPSRLENRVAKKRNVGVFTNADLALKDYLFFNGGARYDRSSTVKDGYLYYTGGTSFIPTKAFEGLKDNNVLNYMKLTASYSKIGNSSSVATYATNDTGVVPAGFPFGTIVGYQLNRIPTEPGIKPEFVTTKEVGLNLGLFKDRVTIDASAYITNTKDLITNRIASTTSGLTNVTGNIGDLENKGFEIDLGLAPVRIENGFNWNLRASYATYKTVVTSLANGVTSFGLQQSNGNGIGIFAEVGEEFPLIKGTKFVRNDAGQIIVDVNGNPTKTSSFQKLGKVNPDYILGLTNTFTYKGISLVAVADYRTGHSIYSETYRNLQFTGGAIETASQDRFKGYILPNSVQFVGGNYVTNTTPVYSQSSPHGLNGQVNDYFNNISRTTGETNIVDATALKIRELSLSYNLPSKMLENTGIDSFKFGVNARNPFVLFFADGNHGLKNLGYTDPESANTNGNGAGISEVGQYPTLKTYGFSINVIF